MISDKRALMRHMMKVKQEHIRKYMESVLLTEDQIEGQFLYGRKKNDM